MRVPIRRRLAVGLSTLFLVAALAGAGLVAMAPGAGAGGVVHGPVDPSIADGDPDSLRDVVENQTGDGDTVLLVGGATYEICGELVVAYDMTIEGNGATIRQTCEDERVINVDDVVLTLTGTTVTGGNGASGAGIDVNYGGLVLVQSTVSGNSNVCGEAGGVKSDDGAFLRIVQSTISGNTAREDAAIDMDEGGELTMLNSTVSGNSGTADGAVMLEDGAVAAIVYSTIAANAVIPEPVCDEAQIEAAERDDVATLDEGEPANLGAEDGTTLRVFGTVIALPSGGPNCAADTGGNPPLSGTDSAGYNFSDDATCGLTAGTDRQTAGDPLLGPLAANGGATLTHLPLVGSPLIDAIPVAACGDGNDLVQTVVTDDQRGVTRPQGSGCETGSVEVVPAAVIEPTFTG